MNPLNPGTPVNLIHEGKCYEFAFVEYFSYLYGAIRERLFYWLILISRPETKLYLPKGQRINIRAVYLYNIR